jgi:acylphosphatase
VRAVRVEVSGRVQGVGFRYSVQRRARERGVAGWVRNREDGTVEAWLEGEEDAVDSVLEVCRSGPRGAGVAEVKVDEGEAEGLAGFEVR